MPSHNLLNITEILFFNSKLSCFWKMINAIFVLIQRVQSKFLIMIELLLLYVVVNCLYYFSIFSKFNKCIFIFSKMFSTPMNLFLREIYKNKVMFFLVGFEVHFDRVPNAFIAFGSFCLNLLSFHIPKELFKL